MEARKPGQEAQVWHGAVQILVLKRKKDRKDSGAGGKQSVEPEPLPEVRGGGWKGIPSNWSFREERAQVSWGEKAG